MIHRRSVLIGSQGRRGSALLLTCIVSFLVMGIGGAFLAETLSRSRSHARSIEGDETQMMCDAALERARVALLLSRNLDGNAWDYILSRCSPTLESWTPEAIRIDYRSRMNLPPFTGHDATRDTSVPALSGTGEPMVGLLFAGDGSGCPAVFGRNVPFWKGAYFIQIRNNADGAGATNDQDGKVFIRVTATLPDGTQRRIEALVQYPGSLYTPPAALLTGGTLSLRGAFSILGTSGSVHSNEDILGTGSSNATVSVSVRAAGSSSQFSMNNPPPGGIRDGSSNPPASIVPIPAVDPTQYRNDPTLTPNMVVLNKYGQITGPSGGSAPSGDYPFSFNNGSWTISGGGEVTPAIYYVEGDFQMTGQGNAAPYQMTILATGSVSLGGNSKFVPFSDPVTGQSTNTLVMAGGDLSLTGTGGASSIQYTGVAMAHEQVLIRGNYTMAGAVIGENAVDQNPAVTTGNNVEDSLQGNATITYNGMTTFVRSPQQSVIVLDVRRLK